MERITPPLPATSGGVIQKTVWTFEMIKFSHSIFAVPFALAAMVVATKGRLGIRIFLLIVGAMVTARSAAMAFNRIVDATIDAKNPRTRMRHIPKGILSKNFVAGFTLICIALFFLFCRAINPMAFALSPIALAIILGYSFTKRFTSLSHLWLGLSLGIAPLAASIAVTGEWPWRTLSLGVAVMFWVAGFDIIYATQDADFDKQTGLHSLVARFGINKALWISRGLHLFCTLFLILFGLQNALGFIYFITVLVIAAGLFYEQSLVKPNDLSRVNAAFFNTNGIISLLFLAGIILEYLSH